MNWKRLFKHYLATVNDTEIKFKVDKLDYIMGIIRGKERSRMRIVSKNNSNKEIGKEGKEPKNLNKDKSQKKSVKTIPSYSIVTELNLNPKGKTKLKDFYAKYKPKSNPENCLVIVYYLEREISEREISENKIYSCYKNLQLPVPNLRQTLQNIHARNGWINTSNFSDLKVTVTGENYLEHQIEKNS